MNTDNYQFLATVLTNLNDGSADWATIATQRDIARKDNAMTSFKNMLKKIGLEYDGKKFNPIAGFDIANLEAGATPRKVATPRKRKGDSDSVNSSPTKKRGIARKVQAKSNEDENSKEDLKGPKTENGVEDGVQSTSDA